ncbi:MAG: RNA methyltransferase [Gammaproteobacteria bacterium]
MKPRRPVVEDNAPGAALLSRARVVLHGTTHSGNIGAAARAMKTMGIGRLYLAEPRALIDSAARAMAAGALDVLAAARVCDDLPSAISDCATVFAFTARPRDFSPVSVGVREAGAIAAEKMAASGEIAFVFGGERSGLSNEDVRRAGYVAAIPSSAAYWSLNLAQAVQVAVYELRCAVISGGGAEKTPADAPPTQEQMEMLLAHCGEFLADIKMPKRGDGGLLPARLRRLLSRAEPDASEIRMLRGILTAARKKTANSPCGE